MSDEQLPPARGLDDVDAPARRALVVRTAIAATTAIAAIVAAYFLIPWDGRAPGSIVVRIALALGILLVAVILAVRNVVRAEYPVLRAIEALATLASLAIVAFASAYLLVSTHDAAAFSEPLGRVDALYFSLTTATTVGFGDINAKSDTARVVVMLQMVVNVVVVGVAARVLLHTARKRIGR